MRNAYSVLVGKSEGKGLFGRHGHRWEDNVMMNHGKIGWEAVDVCIWLRIGTIFVCHKRWGIF
jgi:hypothetical protein